MAVTTLYKFSKQIATQLSPNFSGGRPYGAPNVIVIHHWGVDGQSHTNVANYLCRPKGNSSAHYVASAGRVTMLVNPDNRAWHAGKGGNPRGIGIECRPEMSAGDFETVAQLVAYLRGRYGNLPLRGHKDFMNTACPGRWYGQLARLSARADQILKYQRVTVQAAPELKDSDGDGVPDANEVLAVDGVLGPKSVAKLQSVLGTPVDGVISGQYKKSAKYFPALDAVKFGGGGSQAVKALQGKLGGLDTDGYLGPLTVTAWQKKLGGLDTDGYLGIKTAKAIQKALNKEKLW